MVYTGSSQFASTAHAALQMVSMEHRAVAVAAVTLALSTVLKCQFMHHGMHMQAP